MRSALPGMKGTVMRANRATSDRPVRTTTAARSRSVFGVGTEVSFARSDHSWDATMIEQRRLFVKVRAESRDGAPRAASQ